MVKIEDQYVVDLIWMSLSAKSNVLAPLSSSFLHHSCSYTKQCIVSLSVYILISVHYINVGMKLVEQV